MSDTLAHMSEAERETFLAAALAYYDGQPPAAKGSRSAVVPHEWGTVDHVQAFTVRVNRPWKSLRHASKSDRIAHKELRTVTRVKQATTTRASRDHALMHGMGSIHAD